MQSKRQFEQINFPAQFPIVVERRLHVMIASQHIRPFLFCNITHRIGLIEN